jgi:hypothetical protein
MTRTRLALTLVPVLAVLIGCDLVDPMRPSPQPDSETFGSLLEVTPDPTRPEAWVARLKVGVPRALGRADGAEPTPDVAGGILAVVTVTRDTVVLTADRPTAVEDIVPGTELVVLPVAGTTTMYGESELHLEAAQLLDFTTYARWRMPKLALAGAEPPVEDPGRVNSAGAETAPIPVGDGRVLYFTARLRSPELPGGPWLGARRDGLATPAEGGRSVERSFRTELGEAGWSVPEPVRIPGLGEDEHVKLSWVGADERTCFVTVSAVDGAPWVGVCRRPQADAPWGEPVRLEAAEAGDAFDAVALAGSTAKLVFATTRSGGGDLYLLDPAAGPAQPLQPEINSGGLEWGPRVGPAGELYFVRGDRQLRFHSGRVDEVRLPGPHRAVIVEAAPSADGAWLFYAAPKPRPVELDFDILVAPLAADGSLGEPVGVDAWRPEGPASR